MTWFQRAWLEASKIILPDGFDIEVREPEWATVHQKHQLTMLIRAFALGYKSKAPLYSEDRKLIDEIMKPLWRVDPSWAHWRTDAI